MTEAEAKIRKEQFMAGFRLGSQHAAARLGRQLPDDATYRFAQGYKCGHDEYWLEHSYSAKANPF